MIELIFAIVVIGITVVSLPMMIQVNFKGIEGNIKQEAIFATSAKMMQVLSYAWDENSTDTNNSNPDTYSKVIPRAGPIGYNRETNTSIFRVGHIKQGLHRRFFDVNESIDGNLSASIQGQMGNSDLNQSAYGQDGYKYEMRLSTSVSYVDDTIAGPTIINLTRNASLNPTSNIRLITITTIIDSNNDDAYNINNDDYVRLRAFATNIGEIDYNKRRY